MGITYFHNSEIEKENISKLYFKNEDVLMVDKEKALRASMLMKAVILGNGYKRKAKIFFRSIQGSFKVETTVWSVTKNHIALKGGILIPISSINKVEFF